MGGWKRRQHRVCQEWVGVGARSQSQGILLGLPQTFSTDKFKDLIFQPQRVSRLVSDPFNAA